MDFCLFCLLLVCLSCGRGEAFFSKFSNRKKSESGYVNDESVNVCETVKVMPRIAFAVVGGSPLRKENSAPYITAIGERLSNGSVSWFCGGSLLSQNDILTAAHCLVSRNVTTVRLGSFSTKKGSTENDYEISEAIIHPGYKITQSYDDVAVIKVKDKISFSQNIKPVCLPQNDNDKYDKERAKVIGWGAEEFGGDGTHKLQQVEVQVFTNADCEKAYSNSTIAPKTFPKGITRQQLCAGSPRGGKDACQGDSGGPLVLTDESGIVRQIGVVSTGAGCGFKTYPGVYTRVSSYVDWIQQQIKKSGSPASSQNKNSFPNDHSSREKGESSKQRETTNTRPLPQTPSKGQSSQYTKNESDHDNKPANRTSPNNNNNNNNHLSNTREDHNSRERLRNEQPHKPIKSERNFQDGTQTGTQNNSSSHNKKNGNANNNSREHNSQREFSKNDKLSGLNGDPSHNYNHLQSNGNQRLRQEDTTMGSLASRERPPPHLHEKPSDYETNSRPSRRPSSSPTSDNNEETRMGSQQSALNSQGNTSKERNNFSRRTATRVDENSSREQTFQNGDNSFIKRSPRPSR